MGESYTPIFVFGGGILLLLCGEAAADRHRVPSVTQEMGTLGHFYSGLVSISQEYSYRFTVLQNDENLLVSSTIHPYHGTTDHPVTFSVRQQRSSQSWELPIKSASGKVYRSAEKTICISEHRPTPASPPGIPGIHFPRPPQDSSLDIFPIVVTVTVSTISPALVNFTLVVSNNSHLLPLGVKGSVTVTYTTPQIIHFRFPPEDQMTSPAVSVTLKSPDDLCLTVSVQEPTCPFLDHEYNARYKGLWYTMTKRGAVTLTRSQYPNGFFLILVLHATDKECQMRYLPSLTYPGFTRTKDVTLKIQESLPDSRILIGWIFVPAACLLLIIYVHLSTFCMRWCQRKIDDFHQRDGASDPGPKTCCSSWKPRHIITLDQMSVITAHQIKQKSRRYLHLVWPVALYYFLPALQLVTMYAVTSHKTGNLDLCYYNFECAYPVGPLTDANHVYSNAAYLIMGLASLIWIWMHQVMSPAEAPPQKPGEEVGVSPKGIPPHYGLSYALAIVILVEGLLSASYHVCPNHSNFHHDTCFMYVAVTLTTLKLYHARHPSTNVGATTTFGVLGAIMVIDFGGEMLEYWWYFGAFTGLHVVSFLLGATRLYFLGYRPMWSLKNMWIMLRNDRVRALDDDDETPVAGKDVWWLIMVGAAFNFAVFVSNALKFHATAPTGSFDFGSYLLTILGGNMTLYFFYYLLMKKIHGEVFGIPNVVHLITAVGLWIVGGYNFIDIRTSWEETPAQSRTYNRPCTFFDSHDLWHMLSAAALYTTLTAIEFLDQPLANTPRSRIPVF